MLTKRKIVSLSLSPKTFFLLKKISEKQEKSRSEVIKDLIRRYYLEQRWQEIFTWGKQTAKKLKIKTEADILRLIND